MNYQQAHIKGYQTGQRLYNSNPELSIAQVRALVDKTSDKSGVPLTMFVDYRDGVVAGYLDKRREKEVK